MKWTKPAPPALYTKRTRTRFAWWPIGLGKIRDEKDKHYYGFRLVYQPREFPHERIWLEQYKVEEMYATVESFTSNDSRNEWVPLYRWQGHMKPLDLGAKK